MLAAVVRAGVLPLERFALDLVPAHPENRCSALELGAAAQVHLALLEEADEVEVVRVGVDPGLLPAAGAAVVDGEAQPLVLQRRPRVEALDDHGVAEVEVDGVRPPPVVAPGAVPLAEPEVELAGGVLLGCAGLRRVRDAHTWTSTSARANELGA